MFGVRCHLLSFHRKRLVICVPLKTPMNYFILTAGDIALNKLCHWPLSALNKKQNKLYCELALVGSQSLF